MAGSTIFDNKYIIYKNTPGLRGNINNNLTDSFRLSGIPLSATLTGSFTIDSFSKTMSWTGTLTLTPTDSCCTYLKCKSGDGSAQYFYAQNGKFKLGSSGQIGVAEFGFGILCTDAYLWDGKNILSNLHIPVEMVEAVGENDLNEQSSFTSDIVDVYGDTIEYEYLNQIASYHTIPRYYLGNKTKSFKGISFDYNVKSSSDNITDSSSDDGQFVFDDEVKYKGGNKKDAKYWSFSPQVYPIVIFNKTCDRDLEEGYLQSVYASGLKTHSLSWKNNILNIDNKTITLQDNDLVVAYIRTPGVWTVENNTFPSWGYVWGEDYFKDFSTNKGRLTCSPIKIFQLTAPANDLSFSLKTTDSTYQQFFTKKEINHYAFKSIIQTKNFTSNNVLDISNVADYVHDRNGIEFKSFGEIEKKSVWFTTHYYLKSFCDFTTKTWEVNNFQYVNQSSIGDVFSLVYSYRPSRDSYINRELDGSWDPKTNYYTSCYINGKMYAEGDDGKPDSWDQSTSYLESLGLEVAGIRRHTWGHAITTFLAPVGMFPSFCGYFPNKYLTSKDFPDHEEITTYYGSNGEYYFRAERDFADYPMERTTWLKIGYQYIVDTTTNESPETFALAIVVWRNGKLVGFNGEQGKISWKVIERGYALTLQFVNETNSTIYIEEGSDVNGVSNKTQISPYDTITITINNIDEVIHWMPTSYVKYTDPNTNQEVKVYLKDI